MKRLFTVTTIIMVLLLSFVPTAYAEQFDGFSIEFPSDFTGAYTAVDSETQSDFFTENLLYETESDYELMRVLIGQSANLDTLFSEDFGFVNRQDLDLSLLTEKQLADEAEKLTAYIDMSFPLYMTYLTPKSMMVDDRLGLVVTGYYTDFSGGLTGEFRAYEFYYMGQVIILYYDTQIEGTYFVESVFDLPDSIVGTLDFELNPSVQPMNPVLIQEMLSTAAPLAGLLAAAVIIGVLFGLMLKKRTGQDDVFSGTASAESMFADKAKPEKKPTEKKEKTKTEKKKSTSPAPVTPELPKSNPAEEEAVDWNSMINDLKKELPETESEVSEQTEPEPKKATEKPTPEAPQVETKPESTTKAEKKTEKTPEVEAIDVVDDVHPDAAEQSDPLLAQLKAMDDMSAEIAQTLGALSSAEQQSQPVEAKKAAETKPPKTAATKTQPATPETQSAAPDLPASASAQAVSKDYQNYLDSLLPSRKKAKKKLDDASEKPKKAKADTEVIDKKKAQADVQNIREKLTKSVPEDEPIFNTIKKEKKQGLLSRVLSSMADRVERDGEEDTEPEFDSRMEMHISEKTERHSVEKLMPGLFDDNPEEESVEILLDQNEDLKFERSKKKPATTEEERSKLLKNRVDNLFEDK